MPLSFRIRATAFAVAALAAAGCENLASRTGASLPRCEAVESLPGSTPMPADLRSSVAAASVPADALQPGRRTCNRLALEPSTFARRHAVDAVDWRPWSKAAFDEAEALGRPLFVWSGFSGCDECATLAAASFGEGPLAAEINASFVPVLVDRDARPDVDAYLMLAVQVLTGGGGWPAAVFVDTEARPFEAWSWGAASAGRVELAPLVTRTARRVALGGTAGERAVSSAEKMQARASRDWSAELPAADAVSDALRAYLLDAGAKGAGVYATPPLFPRPPLLDFLLRRHRSRGDTQALAIATGVLDAVLASPMVDEDSGALHRFARAPRWKEPADGFLLAENAAVAAVLVDAAAEAGRDEYRDAARRILGFVQRELALEGGAFAASVDARGRDGAMLADANATAISAFARASTAFGDRRLLDVAVAAATALDAALRDGGFVRHARWPDGTRSPDGYLADQALVALAFVDLDAAGAGGRWLEAARAIADAMPAAFEHDADGGFFQARATVADVPLRLEPGLDQALPCGNSAAALLYARLASRTGDARYAALARRTLEAYAEVLGLRPLAVPSMVVARTELQEAAPAR